MNEFKVIEFTVAEVREIIKAFTHAECYWGYEEPWLDECGLCSMRATLQRRIGDPVEL